MPIIAAALLVCSAASATIAPLFLIVMTHSVWPLLFYVPYLLTVWFFKTAPAVYS